MWRFRCLVRSFSSRFLSDLLRQEGEVLAEGADCKAKGREPTKMWIEELRSHREGQNRAVTLATSWCSKGEMVCDYTLPIGSIGNLSTWKKYFQQQLPGGLAVWNQGSDQLGLMP